MYSSITCSSKFAESAISKEKEKKSIIGWTVEDTIAKTYTDCLRISINSTNSLVSSQRKRKGAYGWKKGLSFYIKVGKGALIGSHY